MNISSCIRVGLLLSSATLTAAENLVFNGDLEAPSPASPPPGWVMWGANIYKNPENYTRDTTNPHSGEACLRIHHPADTTGYIVTSLEYAIRPRQDKLYRVGFWARGDEPGTTAFWLGAYSSIDPYVDAPGPGRFTYEVGTTWQEYTFEVCEGWDFFANRSRYVMLCFTASQDRKKARTLWVDDVTVVEEPSPRQGRLADVATLAVTPLEHRLVPGNELAVTIDTGGRLRRATRDAGGISFHRVAGWTGHPFSRDGITYTLPPATEAAIRDLHLPMTRFYAVGAEPFPLEEAIDKAADVCRRVNVPLDHCVLEFETQGATQKLEPDTWIRGVRHAHAKGYGFRYWEVANEPYIRKEGAAFATPDDYAAHVREVSAAIRAEAPGDQIGVGIPGLDERWGNYVLKQAAGSYDFVAAHHYAPLADILNRRFEVAVLTENYAILEKCLRLNALIQFYNPGRDVYQYDTEWGMHSHGPNGERADNVARNANILGTLHRAVRLIYYAREDILRGASSWQMLNSTRAPGFGILAPGRPDARYMMYWLYYHFNRHVGDWVLPIRGTAPFYTPGKDDDPRTEPGAHPGPLTPILVTLDEAGGSVLAVVVNGSWEQAVACRLNLPGFPVAAARAIRLSDDDLDRFPLFDNPDEILAPLDVTFGAGSVNCTLPPHAVVFLRITPRK